MFIWMLQSRFEILAQLKIVLKAQLKQIPGPGKIRFLPPIKKNDKFRL
jgi:hypothetical protein